MTQVELAVAMGDRYDQTMISKVEHGVVGLLAEGLRRAATELNVSLDYLLGLTDIPTAPRAHDAEACPVDYVPICAGAVAAGVGNETGTPDSTSGVMPFRRSFLDEEGMTSAHCGIYRVVGDSMAPVLVPGCSILVDYRRTALCEGGLFVIKMFDQLLVMRATLEDQWWLVSENDPNMSAPWHQALTILGQVKWSARTF